MFDMNLFSKYALDITVLELFVFDCTVNKK